jgi:hypothetical protein
MVCYLLVAGLAILLVSALYYGVDVWAASFETSLRFSAWVRDVNYLPDGQVSIYGLARSDGFDDAQALAMHGASVLVLLGLFLWRRCDGLAVLLGLSAFPYQLVSGLIMLLPVAGRMMAGDDRLRGLLLFALIMPWPWAHPSTALWLCVAVLLIPAQIPGLLRSFVYGRSFSGRGL